MENLILELELLREAFNLLYDAGMLNEASILNEDGEGDASASGSNNSSSSNGTTSSSQTNQTNIYTSNKGTVSTDRSKTNSKEIVQKIQNVLNKVSAKIKSSIAKSKMDGNPAFLGMKINEDIAKKIGNTQFKAGMILEVTSMPDMNFSNIKFDSGDQSGFEPPYKKIQWKPMYDTNQNKYLVGGENASITMSKEATIDAYSKLLQSLNQINQVAKKYENIRDSDKTNFNGANGQSGDEVKAEFNSVIDTLKDTINFISNLHLYKVESGNFKNNIAPTIIG